VPKLDAIVSEGQRSSTGLVVCGKSCDFGSADRWRGASHIRGLAAARFLGQSLLRLFL